MQKNLYPISSLINTITQRLHIAYEHESIAIQDAWLILSFITKQSKTALITQSTIFLTNTQENLLKETLAKIIQDHTPLAYIIGTIPFLDLTIAIEPPVLIPRQETEYWCNELIVSLEQKGFKNEKRVILDLCTGSGCIGLALAKAFPKSNITAVDISPLACMLAKKNALQNAVHNLTVIQSDLFTKLPQNSFDIIVANPPYIDPQAFDTLEPSVRNWEDKNALCATDKGLACINKIITQTPHYLSQKSPHKALFIEISPEQKDFVTNLFYKCNFDLIIVHRDLGKKNRVISGVLKSIE